MKATKWTIAGNTMLAAAAVLALASCYTVQPYVPPSGGETAKLLIRSSIPGGMAYGVFAFEDAHACRNPQRMVTGTAAIGNQSSTLRAGPLSTLTYIGTDRSRMCRVTFSFYPKAHHTYLLATSQDGVGCSVRLADATDGDNLHAEKSFVRRVMNGSGCDPLNKNVRTDAIINESYQGAEQKRGASVQRSLDDFKDLLPQ